MPSRRQFLALALSAFALSGSAQTPEFLRSRAAELDAKFAALKTAKSEEEADNIVSDIWTLWMQSGREEIDRLVRESVMLFHSTARTIALSMLNDVVKRAPDYAEGWNKRATLLYLMGEFDRSQADCEEVLRREPRHFGALSGLGLIGIAKQDYKAALAAYRRALEVNPFLKERAGIIPALEKTVDGDTL